MQGIQKHGVSTTQEQFAQALGQALRSAAEQSRPPAPEFRVVLPPSEAPREKADGLAVSIDLAGELAGQFHLLLAPEDAKRLLIPEDNSGAVDLNAAWCDFVRDAAKELEPCLESEFGRIHVKSCATVAAADCGSYLAEIRLRAATGDSETAVGLYVSPELGAQLQRLANIVDALAIPAQEFSERERLERVIHVPLTVTLRFGQRQLTVRELLALTTGSLIELDRQVGDPVDLMLGDRIVARGEVVIVDGNYGLRIQELVETGTHRLSAQTAALLGEEALPEQVSA